MSVAGSDLVTVVVPARNEEQAIEACLRSILDSDHRALEVLVVDGASEDGTRARVAAIAAVDDRVRVVPNPDRLIPIGLNRALAAARGRWLVRVDAHATIPPDYVSRAVSHLRSGRWGGVGGRKDGVGRTPAGRAIAAAMGSRFGVGGSTYHHGTDLVEVEHVPFGAYPVDLARELGGWDERLAVNQDFEFDHRVGLAGRPLLFDPALRIDWECRQRVPDLFRQYRRYGRGKVRVMALHPSSTRPRHLVAPALVAWLAGAAVVGTRSRRAAATAVVPYLAGLAVASSLTAGRVEPDARRWLPPAFAAMHVGWGLGFWQGVLDVAREGRLPARISGAPVGPAPEPLQTPATAEAPGSDPTA